MAKKKNLEKQLSLFGELLKAPCQSSFSLTFIQRDYLLALVKGFPVKA